MKLWSNEKLDLVVTDVMMPGRSGVDLCRTIKGDPRWRAIPVILLTAFGEPEALRRGLEVGADDFQHKPPEPGVLLLKVPRKNLRLMSPLLLKPRNDNSRIQSSNNRFGRETDSIFPGLFCLT